MKPSQNQTEEVRRLEAAAAFSTSLVENGRQTSVTLEAWLAADPENRRVWAQRQHTWELFDQHLASPELLDLRQRALNDARLVAHKRWQGSGWGRWKMAAGIAVLAIVGGAAAYSFHVPTYSTGLGERRVVTLPDGSELLLDAQTRLKVDYSSKARELTLLKGQARFQVARDVVRPFSVLADGRRVVAMGTVFTVDLLNKELRVTLIEGRVAVVDGATTELSPGQQLKAMKARPPEVTKTDVQRVTAWEAGKLVFEDEPLSEVVQRISRYTHRQVSVFDPATGSLRMSGVFATGDLDTFLATVTDYLQVTAQEVDGGILLKRGL